MMIRSVLNEYGLCWAANRLLYFLKLKAMSAVPAIEAIFEKKPKVKRINLFDFNLLDIKRFLADLPPDKKDEVTHEADRAMEGIITGFSSVSLDYGNPINWHYNPITKTESRRDLKWYRISDFDENQGDIKTIWEASRFTHFLCFARAFLITGESKYYEAYSSQLEHWLVNNPYSYGANFKCGQESSLRMINALIAYEVFKCSNLIKSKDEENVKKLVELCYRKILSNFFYAHKCIKNNHTFSEICGIIVGAWCCVDEVRVKKAYRLLDQEINTQFLQDGGYTQYSFNYQRFTMQILECILKISQKTGQSIHIHAKEKIKKSILMMYQIQSENGDVPNYGSNDGSLIFPLNTCGYRDFRPVLNTLYALIEGKRLYDPGDYDEELLWFGAGLELPVENVVRKSSNFMDSGFYILRNREGFLMMCLQDFQSRPSHMDQLHIDLWHRDINLFCDSGTFSYASNLGAELALTAGHNTGRLVEVEQMNKRGVFFITDWTKRKEVDYDHEGISGTMVSRNGYEHKRKVKKTGEGYAVLDEINGKGEFCEVYFHTPSEVRLTTEGFDLVQNNSVLCSININSGKIENRKAYRSLYYLKKEEINCVTVINRMKHNRCSMNFNIKLF